MTTRSKGETWSRTLSSRRGSAFLCVALVDLLQERKTTVVCVCVCVFFMFFLFRLSFKNVHFYARNFLTLLFLLENLTRSRAPGQRV